MQLPEIVRAQDIPGIPPPLCGIGVRPRLSFGDIILFPRIVESQIYGYDKHTQIPADLHPRRVQRVERHPANPDHPQRADGQVFLRIWR